VFFLKALYRSTAAEKLKASAESGIQRYRMLRVVRTKFVVLRHIQITSFQSIKRLMT
jgi:hypothetical protein